MNRRVLPVIHITRIKKIRSFISSPFTMVRISLITLFTLICACIAVYAIWTIKVSRQKQQDTFRELKKTGQPFNRSNDVLQKDSTGAGAIKRNEVRLPEVELAIKASAITRCIDSMKHDLVLMTKQKGTASFSYPDKHRLLALKNNLAGYNSFIQEKFPGKPNIKPGDFINVADVPLGPAAVPWEIHHFTNSSVFSMITELSFIHTQVLKLKHKATH